MLAGSQQGNANPDMESLFKEVELELRNREQHIARLQQTFETFQQKPEFFDEKDFLKITAVLQRRNEEFAKLHHDFTAARELYNATVLDLETKIKERENMVKQTDNAYGSISAEDELRLHFAQKQAVLLQGLMRAKAQLCSTIYERLKPSQMSPSSP